MGECLARRRSAALVLMATLASVLAAGCEPGSATTSPPTGAPTGLTTVASVSSISAFWSPVPGATGYNIYYGTAPTETKASHQFVATTPHTDIVLAGLQNFQTYTLTVTATNMGGESAESGPVSSMPTANLATGYAPISIAFTPFPSPPANMVTLFHNDITPLLPIGFNFVFYGQSYTQFWISSYGFIGFGPPPSAGAGCCFGFSLPSGFPNNLIALAWTDLDPTPPPPVGTYPPPGVIQYETIGTPPNRTLIVSFINVPQYCGGSYSQPPITVQAVLHETLNYIEIFTTSIPNPPCTWFTQGIEDSSGTLATFFAGRTFSSFGYSNDGIQFQAFP
jgi:hypothetical protein